MLWAALLTDSAEQSLSQREAACMGLAWWCLQFSPHVAILDAQSPTPAVLMELAASVRLFGGKRGLVERVKGTCAELGVRQLSWAPTSLAALALARCRLSNGFAKPLDQVLDALPIESLTAVAAHQATLQRLGCQTLGHLRALPRGGISRRFDGQLLVSLDQAYGLRPEVYPWVNLPETFKVKLELMARVELAPALLFGARRLLLLMVGWLAARQSGVTGFTLHWCHDTMRAKSAGDGGQLTVRTAQATRDIEHLCRLLAEHLAKVQLLAPVGDLELEAVGVRPLEVKSLSMLPEVQDAMVGLALVLERVAARLGPARVLRPVVQEDHRLEWMCQWQSAAAPRPGKKARLLETAQPSFVLAEPLRLAMRGSTPMYQGVLQLLVGPQRVEGGWWDRGGEAGAQATRHVVRDYWVAQSEHAGVLWIFQTRLGRDATAWYLHGTFA